MKNPAVLIAVLCICVVTTAHNSELIFKKEITLSDDENYIFVADINTAKFDKVKIAAISDGTNYRRTFVLLQTYEADEFAGESETLSFDNNSVSDSKMIELPSSILKIKAKGRGKLKIFVWAK